LEGLVDEETPVEHVFVFLDWQNVYMRARESFHDPYADAYCGQVDPLDLALELCKRGAPGARRQLAQVRIYRGIPDQAHDARGYAAARRQIGQWEKDSRVKVFTRPLRYPDGWTPSGPEKAREKGVDVQLALDVVTCGLDGMYDTGIVFSADQDLVPALEYMDRRRISRGKPRMEVVAWKGDYGRRPNRISIGGGRPYCHWLDNQAYWGMQDETDYTQPVVRRTVTGPPKPGPRR
jgi:uncharacterized LabA/DUF88 family protein